MHAAVMRDNQLVVDEVADPKPRPARCWSARWPVGSAGPTSTRCSTATRWSRCRSEAGACSATAPTHGDDGPGADVVMGHEFCGEVIELGENVGNCQVGDVVVSVPMTFDMAGLHPIGYSNVYPAATPNRWCCRTCSH